MSDTGQGPGAIERPALANETGDHWGSDVMALMLREIGLPYVALNPGASYRGLHDSLVNLLGNQAPQMLLCLHEEHAVAIAHGYAKVAGKPMGAIVHSNVGLMHATMAVFNAWCDRAPVVLLGATGPVAADKRRPWIDWIHTAADQGALVRNYTKWDDQPASVGAVPESLLRAYKIATTPPCGPVYVCFDAALQETRIGDLPALPTAERARKPRAVAPDPEAAKEAAELLQAAQNPVILMGRVSRSEADWERRLKLAEALGAIVLTDPKTGASFPTRHRLQGPPAGNNPSPEACEVLRAADVVLSLDWVDLGGALKTAWGDAEVKSKVILASLDHQLHNGWSMDYQGLPPIDLHLAVEPDIAVAAILPLLRPRPPGWARRTDSASNDSGPSAPADVITPVSLAAGLRDAVGSRTTCLIRTPLAWGGHVWETNHPLDLLGGDGGGGIGGGRHLDGHHRAVDGGSLPHPGADRRRQQQLVLQRRAAPGPHGAPAQPPGRQPLDRPAHRRPRARSRHAGARPGRDRVRPGARSRRAGAHLAQRHRNRRGRWRRAGRCPGRARLRDEHGLDHRPARVEKPACR